MFKLVIREGVKENFKEQMHFCHLNTYILDEWWNADVRQFVSLFFDFILSILQRTLCPFKQLHQISTSNVPIASVERKCKQIPLNKLSKFISQIQHLPLTACRTLAGLQLSNGHKNNRQLSKTQHFYRQPSKELKSIYQLSNVSDFLN